MKQKILIAHARGEDTLAEQLAAPLIKEGYEAVHIGTIAISESIIEELSKCLTEKTPVLFCATYKAVASKWARHLVNAARNIPGVRVFALQMDEEVYMEQLILDEKYGKYWENPTYTMNELKEALRKYYPIDGSTNSGIIMQAALNNYYAEIRKRYQRLDLDSLTPRQKSDYLEVQLRSVYVEQHVRDNPPPVDFPPEILERLQKNNEFEQGELPEDIALEDVKRVSDVYYKKPPRPVLDILSDVVNQHVVILGDPGSGKSTLTRFIILSLIDVTQDSKIGNAFPDYLPLLIELKSYIDLIKKNDKYKNFIDYFEYLKQSEGYYFEKEILHTYLKTTGKAIVIFDGLDEIFEPQERDQVCRHIDNFKETYPGARIIVTSRIVGFRRRILTDTGFRIFTLQDLDEPQIKEFVEKWFSIALYDRKEEFTAERCNLIMAAVKDSTSIRQLAGNPMLLTIMSILSKNQELPRERWKLYDHAAQVLIEIWDVNKYLEVHKLKSNHIDEEDKREMLQKIAFKMQIGKGVAAGNYIIEKELQNEFEKYIIERYQ
ncbi:MULTISPECIES: hypothetical protein [Niastella]|uniref:NACHT domain-containing protein n=1 Tax=Niastella soli TaxID=2821487 RepID=A0ABS3YVX7_9BACT|nr:hypothetical protein [Niastella soli]MBO9202084.1 hypothetical protein [Niastella soli]